MKNGIMLVGEYVTDEDLRLGGPFSAGSGYIIKSMMRQVGIEFDDCYVTTVFSTPPRGREDIRAYCGPREMSIPGAPKLGSDGYIRKEFQRDLDRLYDEIERVQPNVILALGAASAWGVLGTAGIKAVRGAIAPAHFIGRTSSRVFKTLVSYSHHQIRRDWTLRPIGIADLDKGRREAVRPELIRPERNIWLKPTLNDLAEFERRFFPSAHFTGVDIETKGGQITCIGFAPTPNDAIVIPFWSALHTDGNYWPSLADELAAWSYVRRWCASYPSVFQNGPYDMHHLWKVYGIPCHAATHDTMLLHHALQPEMEKGLGFLGTLYTDEASWKGMYKTATLKKED